VQNQLDRYAPQSTYFSNSLPNRQSGDLFPSLTPHPVGNMARDKGRRSGVRVKYGAMARATSIGPWAATGVSANAVRGIPRCDITQRGGK
jgi:hypothetical protein